MRAALCLVALVSALSASSAEAEWNLPQATYSVSSAAMRPTLEKGMIVGADKIKGFCGATEPRAGDLVLYRRQGQFYISRVVAGPGQVVAMIRGRLVIDGRPVRRQVTGSAAGEYGRTAQVVRETLANGISFLTLDTGPNGELDNVEPYKVGPRSWYLLGDNRDNSADSRVWGPIGAADLCAGINSVLWAKELSRVGHKP
jgi:signal peptidase I